MGKPESKRQPGASGQRPRILLIITKADVGGAQMHVLQIVRELQDRFEFELATGAEDYLTRRLRELGVTVHLLPDLIRPIRPWQDFKALREIGSLISGRRPALVHAHSFKAGLLTRSAALFSGTRCLFTAHGWAFTPGAPAPQRAIGFAVETMCSRLCAGVITVSKHDYDLAKRWRIGSDQRRFLVRNAADPVACRADTSAQPPRLITVGRLTPVKNQVFLLRAVAGLPGDVRLQIIGEGPERSKLEAVASELGLWDRVIFSGEVTDIAEALSGSGIFLLGSHFEGLPLSVLEAMSAGLPVVSTDVGGVSEAVVDGKTGLLVSPGDLEGFTASVERLISDSALRQEMGMAGYRRYVDCFQVDRFREEMRAVYQHYL